MIVKEVYAKTILSKSKVLDYTVNSYIGCEHGCTYCYARYMKRFTGHKEEWGTFVDVKINAPRLLQSEIKKKKVGRVWISGTCDPYQRLEKRYKLTKRCLEILSKHSWPVTIQTPICVFNPVTIQHYHFPLPQKFLLLLKLRTHVCLGVNLCLSC